MSLTTGEWFDARCTEHLECEPTFDEALAAEEAETRETEGENL